MSNPFSGLEIETEAPSRMALKHPHTRQPLVDENKVEGFICVYSTDSEIARRFRRNIKTKRLQTRNRNSITGEKLEAEDIELLAALTHSWHLVSLDGRHIDVECNEANARQLYGNPRMAWLTEDVDAFAADRELFARASSSS